MSKMQNEVKLWQFHGGITPPERKALANQTPIQRLPLPDILYLPLKQHIGAAGTLCVQPGDTVLRGQALTEPGIRQGLPIHAPTSGKVGVPFELPSNHPSQLPEIVLPIKPDGQDRSIQFQPVDKPFEQAPQQLIEHLWQAGIAGLGGAGFPSAKKISGFKESTAKLLVINGAECEPYIVSDDRLMQEKALEIIQGVHLIQHMLQAEQTIFAIEDNKPQAIQAIRTALNEYQQAEGKSLSNLRIQTIPTLYPSGGEKQLIQILTGRQVPSGQYPAELGILMHNVGTAFAIQQAITLGVPLIERVVTLTGESLLKPGTAWALLGTPIEFLLAQAELHAEDEQRVIIGGPMMGYTITDTRIPIIKTTNCILAPTQQELPPAGEESPCIRCGLCEQVCPASLLPQQLQWYAKSQDYQALEAHHLADCIECGACAYVCPSEIPLVHYYRKAKAEIRAEQQEQQKSELARQRYEARQERLEREKQERLEKHKKAAEARAQAIAARETQSNTEAPATAQSDKVAAAIARAKARREAQQATAQPQTEPTESATTPRQASHATQAPNETLSKEDKIAAAIARAKARRAAQQKENPS